MEVTILSRIPELYLCSFIKRFDEKYERVAEKQKLNWLTTQLNKHYSLNKANLTHH